MREMTSGIYQGEFEDYEILKPEEYLEKLSFSRKSPDCLFFMKSSLEAALSQITSQQRRSLEMYFYEKEVLRRWVLILM